MEHVNSNNSIELDVKLILLVCLGCVKTLVLMPTGGTTIHYLEIGYCCLNTNQCVEKNIFINYMAKLKTVYGDLCCE